MTTLKSRFAAITIAAALFLGGGLTGAAIAAQVHMQAALRALTNAQTQLNAAEHDKGGHRENAIKLVGQAIDEVNAGIAAGASHM
jgi:hypothetical protein